MNAINLKRVIYFLIVYFIITSVKTGFTQDLTRLYLERCIAHFKINDYEKVLNIFEQAKSKGVDVRGLEKYAGISAFYLNKYNLSITYLKETLKINPEDEEARLFYGIVLIRLSRYDEAINSLNTILSSDKYGVEANYYAGLAFLKKGQWSDAEERFKIVLSMAPGSKLADASSKYMDILKKEKKVMKWWSFRGYIGQGYDDNVRFEPEFVSNEDSLLSIFSASAIFKKSIDQFSIRGLYTGYIDYHITHRDEIDGGLKRYDLISQKAQFDVGYVLKGDFFTFDTKTGYAFDILHLGGVPYYLRHSANLDIILTEGAQTGTRVRGLLGKRFYNKIDERNGMEYIATLGQFTLLWGNKVYIYPYIGYRMRGAEITTFRYYSILSGINFVINLPYGMMFYIDGLYSGVNYPKGYGSKRRDDAVSVVLKFTKKVYGPVYASIQYVFENTGVSGFQAKDLYEYRKDTTSIFLEWDI